MGKSSSYTCLVRQADPGSSFPGWGERAPPTPLDCGGGRKGEEEEVEKVMNKEGFNIQRRFQSKNRPFEVEEWGDHKKSNSATLWVILKGFLM